MRILLTSNGKKEISQVEQLATPARLNTSRNQSKHRIVKNRRSIQSPLNFAEEEATPAKFIQISQRKLTIPKNLAHRYNADENSDELLKHNGLNISKEDKESVNFGNAVKLKQILKPTILETIRADVETANKNKRKIYSFGSRDYRIPFPTEKEDLRQVNRMLNFQIDSDNNSLINYLNGKGKVNYKLLSVINKYDEDKLGKLNKICQKEIKKSDFNEEIKRRAEEIEAKRYKKLQADLKNSLTRAKMCLNKFKEMASVVQGPTKAWDVVVMKHTEMQEKYWKRSGLH